MARPRKPTPDHTTGESPLTLLERVELLRDELTAFPARKRALEEAHRPAEEAIAAKHAEIDRLADKGLAHLGTFAASALWPQNRFFPTLVPKLDDTAKEATVEATSEIIAALHRDTLKTVVERTIRQECESREEAPVPFADRKRAAEQIDIEEFRLECEEEQLIERAEAAGMQIERRADARPEAILGIERGGILPWNWSSEKYDRLFAARKAAQAEVDAMSEAWQEARLTVRNLERQIQDPGRSGRHVPETLWDQLNAAKNLVSRRHEALERMRQAAAARMSIGHALAEYVEKHQQKPPCETFNYTSSAAAEKEAIPMQDNYSSPYLRG